MGGVSIELLFRICPRARLNMQIQFFDLHVSKKVFKTRSQWDGEGKEVCVHVTCTILRTKCQDKFMGIGSRETN